MVWPGGEDRVSDLPGPGSSQAMENTLVLPLGELFAGVGEEDLQEHGSHWSRESVLFPNSHLPTLGLLTHVASYRGASRQREEIALLPIPL